MNEIDDAIVMQYEKHILKLVLFTKKEMLVALFFFARYVFKMLVNIHYFVKLLTVSRICLLLAIPTWHLID